MGSTWGRQDPGGPHVGHMNLAIWAVIPGESWAVPDAFNGVLLFYHINDIDSYLPGKNGRHFADGSIKCIFMNETFGILIQISLKFVPKAWQ